jgi:ribonuclease P protein component
MLPAAARLRRREDFTLVVRRGRRVGRGALVVHYLPPAPVQVTDLSRSALAPAQAGFVVARAIGGSVARHQVVRRLRHLVRDRLSRLPAGGRLVVRALPAAGNADSADLGRDLDDALDSLLGQSVSTGAAR